MSRDLDAIRDDIARLESRAHDAFLAGDADRLERLASRIDALYREHNRERGRSDEERWAREQWVHPRYARE